ncbi:MAG: response regulator transcription factor [Hyphomicrobiaceae bacterium]
MPGLLIVDDDVPFARVLQRAMVARHYGVRISHDLSDAAEVVCEFKPDFVLLDLNLNGENGVSLIPHIRSVHEDCTVVVLTSFGSLRSAVWAARHGASDYVTKPADADELDHVLKRCVNVTTPLPDVLPTPEDAKEAHIIEFFEKNDRRVSTTARMLGLHRRTLQRILERLGLHGNGTEYARRATPIGRAKRVMRLWTNVLINRKIPARLGTRAGLRNSPLATAKSRKARILEDAVLSNRGGSK